MVRLDLKRNCNDSEEDVRSVKVKVIDKRNDMTHLYTAIREVGEMQETSARERAAARTEICSIRSIRLKSYIKH